MIWLRQRCRIPWAGFVIQGAVRVTSPRRSQSEMRYCSLDDLLPLDHPVRTVRGGGSNARSPRRSKILIHDATTPPAEASSIRNCSCCPMAACVDRRCRRRAAARRALRIPHRLSMALRRVGVNYQHAQRFSRAMRPHLTPCSPRCSDASRMPELVTIHRICQDGLRVRARRRPAALRRKTLLKCLPEARLHLASPMPCAMNRPHWAGSGRSRSSSAGGGSLPGISARRAGRRGRPWMSADATPPATKGEKISPPKRASVSDPESRMMKMPDGGFRPAYNLQFASDAGQPCDRGRRRPTPRCHAADAHAGTGAVRTGTLRTNTSPMEVTSASPTSNRPERKKSPCTCPCPKPAQRGAVPLRPGKKDNRVVADWRRHMGTTEAQAIYLQRLDLWN